MSMNASIQGIADGGHATHAHTGAWVAGVLRSWISAGQLAPGTKLSEQKLSEALGVSRNTLREALLSSPVSPWFSASPTAV